MGAAQKLVPEKALKYLNGSGFLAAALFCALMTYLGFDYVFAPKASTGETPGLLTLDRPMPLEEIEKQAIFSALERNHWKKLATCRELGISKDTLRRKICRYQLANPLADTDDDEDEET